MNIWDNESAQELCRAFMCLESEEECRNFLEDICTIKEIMEISQRLMVAKQLDKGISYNEISKRTGASTATVCRVKRCYDYGSGMYKTMVGRLEK